MGTRLSEQKVLVVGGSSGLGLAIAKAFAEEGADVTIASRNQAKLDAAAARLRNWAESPARNLISRPNAAEGRGIPAA
ncbi:SDR family NAD(P)-dependent oxidoreductase [Brenneria goodwinii]|uniref:SDR family NAD(P)-dependent oxidoreductase n=1 Tax=Brenneria goodwinii TaxID=1109412 RepID=UPI0036E26120